MDGIKAKLGSLQWRLALALTAVMALAAIAIGVIGFYTTLHDAHELQDDYLHDVAALVDIKQLHIGPNDADTTRAASDLEDPDNHVLVQLLDTAGQIIGGDSAIHFPEDLSSGMQTVHRHHLGWRVFVKVLPNGDRLVVAQKTEARNEIAEHAGYRTLVRVLAVIPFLIALLVVLLRWMLRPLMQLAVEINARNPEDMSELSAQGLPTELRPFIFSINAMLRRIAATLDAQRRFVADAAHELRSPLTALTLQTRNFSAQEMSGEARSKLDDFARGLKRANDLVDQLLTMARAQLTQTAVQAPVSLQQVVKNVFEELMPMAEAKKIELGFEPDSDVRLAVGEIDLVTVLRNLVDNALRYSDAGARVDVAIRAVEGSVLLSVRDNGPGIALDQRSRVFDPFYRVLGTGQTGSGLGLSIVQNIVRRLHGEIVIDFADAARQIGTVVTVTIPLASVGLDAQ